jgi:hypothetical protein
VIVVTPPVDERREAVAQEVTFSRKNFLSQMRVFHGVLCRNGQAIVEFDKLEAGATYVLGGGFFESVQDDKTRRKSDDKVLEVEGAECVRKFVHDTFKGDVHLHLNVKDFVKKGDVGQSMEVDGVVVHQGGQDKPNSTAYVVECANAPQDEEVDKLFKKMEHFKQFARSSDHFRSCTTFVPVLVGKNWSNAKTVTKCNSQNVWRVQPGGARYEVVRSFATLLRRVKI